MLAPPLPRHKEMFPPPLLRNPLQGLTDKEGKGTGKTDRNQEGLDSKQTESLIEMVCLDNCVEKDTIVDEVRFDLDLELREAIAAGDLDPEPTP